MKKKRTEITIEIEEVIHVTGHRPSLTNVRCPECGADVPMPATDQTVTRTVRPCAEAGDVRFLETPDGRFLAHVDSPEMSDQESRVEERQEVLLKGENK